MSLSIVFMGTPDFSVPTLTEIVGHGHDRQGRLYPRAGTGRARHGADQEPGPPARRRGSASRCFTPRRCAARRRRRRSAAHDADVAVVVAYGLILPKPVLEAPRLGCLNLHGSLLPRWRGAAPIQRAVMAGDAETGVMVMQMDEGLDTGPVAWSSAMPSAPDMTGRRRPRPHDARWAPT